MGQSKSFETIGLDEQRPSWSQFGMDTKQDNRNVGTLRRRPVGFELGQGPYQSCHRVGVEHPAKAFDQSLKTAILAPRMARQLLAQAPSTRHPTVAEIDDGQIEPPSRCAKCRTIVIGSQAY
ncbi:MAG: hypothetical protein E5Y59_21440 [Mesorhizobium sp.]|nr:MAG: hypothetical protein E5Y59_21440 [Mesorhizobium sp.]